MAPARTSDHGRGTEFSRNVPNYETLEDRRDSSTASSRVESVGYRPSHRVSSSLAVRPPPATRRPSGGAPYLGGPGSTLDEGPARIMPTGTVPASANSLIRGNGNGTPILAGNDRAVNRFHGRTDTGPAVAPNSSSAVVSSSGTAATSTSPRPPPPPQSVATFSTPECGRRKPSSTSSSATFAAAASIQPNTTVAAASFLELTAAAAAAAAFTYDLGLGTFRHPGTSISSNNTNAISVSSHHNPVSNSSLHPGNHHHHVAVSPHHPSLHHAPFGIHPTSYFGTGTPQDENYNPLAACWSDIQTNNPVNHPQAAAFVGYHHHRRGSSSRLEGSVGLGCAGVGEFSPFSHHLAAAATGSTAAHCGSLTNGSSSRSAVSDMAVQRFCQQIRGANTNNTNGAAANTNGTNTSNNSTTSNVSPGLHAVPSLYHLSSHTHHHSSGPLNNVGRQSVNGHHNSHNGHHHHKSKPRRRVATLAQRRAANIRERRRMYNLNSAFDKLRKKVPTFAYEKRLSRIETLRLAIMYIAFMTEVIQASSVPGSGGGRGNNSSSLRNENRSSTCAGEMHVGRSSCTYDNGNVTDLSDANSGLMQQPLLMTSSNRSPSSYGSTIHEDSTWDSPLGSDSSPDTCPSPHPNEHASLLLAPENSLCGQALRVFSSRRI